MMEINPTDTQELQDALIDVRKRKRKKKIILIAIISAVVLTAFIIIWCSGHNYAAEQSKNEIAELKQQIEDLVNTPVVVDPVTPEIVHGILSSQITDISELASAEYLFTNAAKFTSSANSWLPSWMTEKSFIQKWDGCIKAGVSLENVAVSVSENVITISLPYPQILSYEVDYDSVEVLDEKNNVFNPISVDDKNKFDTETAETMKARAIENGLLEKAKQNVEKIITNLLMSSVDNIEDYEIEFVTLEE